MIHIFCEGCFHDDKRLGCKHPDYDKPEFYKIAIRDCYTKGVAGGNSNVQK